MAPKWPRVNNGPEHINEHATYLKEACDQLQAVDRGRQNQIPWNIVQPYLTSTIALIGKILRQPGVGEILQHVQDAARCTQNIQKDITIIKNSVGLSTISLHAGNFSGGKATSASWAQVAAQAKGPLQPPPQPQGTPAPEARPTVSAYKDRMVRVKLKDQGIIQRHRTHPTAWTKQQVETSIRENAATKTVKIVAAHQLKSGDIQIFTSTTAEAEQIKEHQGWVKGLGDHAELIVPTYGVIVHDIATNSINIKDQRAATQQMLADNHTVIPKAEVSYIGWLTKEAPLKRASSIVVEFTDPESANAIIYAGMAWEGQIHQCELYDRSCRVMQCFCCYHYCHITTQCNAPQVCGYCAEAHETKHCKQKDVVGFTPRCAVCKGAHVAWSNACSGRKKEIQRVERAKQGRSIYWHVPPKTKEAATASTRTTFQAPVAATISVPSRSDNPAPASLTILDGPLRATEANTGEYSTSDDAEGPEDAYDILVSPGLPAVDIWEPALTQEIPAELEQMGAEQSATTTAPIPPTEIENLSQEDATNEAMQQADDWLEQMSNMFNIEWPQQNRETGPSPLTSIATDPRTAAGRVYKSCQCPSHQELYDNWPLQDAELKIVKCMKICMYCGKDFTSASEMRRHIHTGLKYARRNLKVDYGRRMIRNETEPGWRQLSRAEMSFSHLRTRSNCNRPPANGTNLPELS